MKFRGIEEINQSPRGMNAAPPSSFSSSGFSSSDSFSGRAPIPAPTAISSSATPFGSAAGERKKNIIGADTISLNPTRIAVFGVGGGGVNAVNHMIQSGMSRVTLFAANTDVQTLQTSLAENVIPLGQRTCRGLGVGGDPIRGAEAAREMTQVFEQVIREYDMVFFATGLGGGTGTGATPVIAEIARDCGVLTAAVVTMPFSHEGQQRMKNATQGLEDIEEIVDALVVIPNDNILSADVISPDLSIDESFTMINQILSNAVSAITDIITIPGTINIDFADIEMCLRQAGRVSIGIGSSDVQGDAGGSAHRATELALKNKIIDRENSATLQTAEKIIINVAAGRSVPVPELLAVPNIVVDRVKGAAPTLKFGYRIEPSWEHKVEVTIVASSPRAAGLVGQGVSSVQGLSLATRAGGMAGKTTGFGAAKSADSGRVQFGRLQDSENFAHSGDLAGKFADADMFARLTGLQAEDDDEALAHTLNSEDLSDPALERLVGIGRKSDSLAFRG